MQIRQKIEKFRTLNLRKKLCYLGEIETKVYRNFYNKKKQLERLVGHPHESH